MIKLITLTVGLLGLIACQESPLPSAPVPAPANPSIGAVSYLKTVAPLLNSKCAGCHTPGGSGSRAIVLFKSAGALNDENIQKNIDTIISVTASGRMPIGGTKLSPTEVAALRSWKEAGAGLN
jgi:mono/diheme cytochrome c family protein